MGANLAADAVYPTTFVDADGRPYHGDHRYVLHFEKGQLPPVDAFWSLTMYDEKDFFVANSIDRYALSSWMPLAHNADGSVDIHIQANDPGPEGRTNWLPTPPGPFNMTMRLYWPKAEAIDGRWRPTAVKRLEGTLGLSTPSAKDPKPTTTAL